MSSRDSDSTSASSTKTSKSANEKSASAWSLSPSPIAATEAWQAAKPDGMLKHVAPLDPPTHIYARQAVQSFEHLTSQDKIKEVERLLEADKKSSIDANCVRNTANWSTVEPHHKFDKPTFEPFKTAEEVAIRSPKLEKILQNIARLDKEDQAKYGHKFKHFIFSDIKGSQGAKAVAAALLANGWQLGYNITRVGKSQKVRITAKTPAELRELGGENTFFLLSSVSIYGEPLLVAVKKDVLRKFNSRPDNSHGDLARIIVMDSGFKEGIDLFDIKYVHIFEPQTTAADQKQVIGRGTRTCGQKGLRFNPQQGWPLYVYKYDLTINTKYREDFRGSETAFAYYLLSKNIDIRILNLASNLERMAIKGSVDYKLNRNIHEFSAEGAELSKGGKGVTPYSPDSAIKGGKGVTPDRLFKGADLDPDSDDEKDIPPNKTGMKAEHRLALRLARDSRPGKKYRVVKHYIDKYFPEYAWDEVKMENLCGYEGPKSVSSQPSSNSQKGGAPALIKLSPTQDFISSYFTAELPLKGMVLWQSVGTGKTCTAIATATRQFEPLGYTILWVTRTTLKNDIWKNMFDMVCHEGVKEAIEAGINVPDDMPGRMKLLSKSWSVRPISYKQFSNLVSKNNQYYDALVKRNGEEDPLRKTLLIIDEAHKLYGGGDLSSIERPDMPAFKKALMNSYAVSGKDSCRVLFMTATPITDSPLELVKLVNLCKPADQQMPEEFDEFADRYLDETGDFTEIGGKMFLDATAGHISYLNREGDVRQFARPILREVAVPLVSYQLSRDIESFDVVGLKATDEHLANLEDIVKTAKTNYAKSVEGFTKKNVPKVAAICKEYPDNLQDLCRKTAKKYGNSMIRAAKERANELKAQITELAKEIKGKRDEKREALGYVREGRKDYPEEYEEYKKSAYSKLKGCEKQWKEMPNFNEFLKTQPGFQRAKELEDTIREELVTVESKLKADVNAQNSRIRSYQKLLKTDLTPLESQVVRRTIQSSKTGLDKTKQRNTKWLKRLTTRANNTIKRLEEHQKKTKTRIKKSIKNHAKEERTNLRVEAKAKRMEEDADEELSDVFHEAVKEAQINTRAEIEEKAMDEEQKSARKLAAAQNKIDAAERKVEKAREVQARKAAKALEAAERKVEKAREVQARKTAKALEAAEKKAAKEAKRKTQKKK